MVETAPVASQDAGLSGEARHDHRGGGAGRRAPAVRRRRPGADRRASWRPLGAASGASHVYVVENESGADGVPTPQRSLSSGGHRVSTPPACHDRSPAPGSAAWAEMLRRRRGRRHPRARPPLRDARRRWSGRSIVSFAEVPVRVAGAWWGCIGMDDRVRDRTWTAAEIDALRAMGAIVAAAEQRRERRPAAAGCRGSLPRPRGAHPRRHLHRHPHARRDPDGVRESADRADPRLSRCSGSCDDPEFWAQPDPSRGQRAPGRDRGLRRR